MMIWLIWPICGMGVWGVNVLSTTEIGMSASSSCNMSLAHPFNHKEQTTKQKERKEKVTHPPSSHKDPPTIIRPTPPQPPTSQLNHSYTLPLPNIPHPHRPIRTNTRQLRLLDRIPHHALNRRRVALEFGAVFDLWLFGVPDSEDARGGACG